MKYDFTRWLPAIAKTPHQWLPAIAKTRLASVGADPNRRVALSVVGVAAIGGLALAPTAAAAPVTSGPHEGAVAAIELATGQEAADPDPTTAGATPTEATTAPTEATTDPDRTAEPAPSGEGSDQAVADQPSREQLIPYGVQGAQSYIQIDDAQRSNAKEIIEVAKDTGVGERGAVIGVATALQESKLYNLGHLGSYNDHDSQGLFQQRPSTGWGTPEQITDPEYASTAFFEALKNVNGWQDLPLTTAAQTVQVSAYPFHYAQWEGQAADLVAQLW
ncbi:hypothetical protein [Salinispora arenicola]|uniref:hypothetical protein n=1 Tax=Salinispora arenicola TaxID=168697 RepID=UPI0003659E26|nr:hypothetical protein [Salinispora arenicola]MCN0181157.1 hypothetical protein [Salinispora arenicola]